MKDYLQDIIEHVHALGNIDLVKITGTTTETQVNAIADDRTVIVSGTFKNPNAEFIGTFGMPNLGKLKTILSFEEYDDKAKINMTYRDREGVQTPEAIHFETAGGDFLNDYRLMAKNIVEEKVKNVTYKGKGWNVEFQPTVASIQRLKKQASANSEEQYFVTSVVGGELKIFFGDASTHSGSFTFASGLTGSMSQKLKFPVTQVLNILNLQGDKTFRITDEGAGEITVDSGLATYRFLLPAQTK